MVDSKRCEIREGIAELEHEQWIEWSKAIAKAVTLPQDRLERWQKLWVPYSELTEEQKDQDRVWADKSLDYLHSQGVAIKVEGELPKELFIEQYCGKSNISREYYHSQFLALPCNCEEDGCHGWVTISDNSAGHHLRFSSPELVATEPLIEDEIEGKKD